MFTIFMTTLSPVLTLFLFMAIGFTLNKANIIPKNANKTLAKLETWVFCPALNFITMARFFTIGSISEHASNLLFAVITVALSLLIAIPLGRLFAKKGSYELNVYRYALAFANLGYMADPLVLSMFGDTVLAYYKLFCLPLNIVINIWGISVLTPKKEGKTNIFARLFNAQILSMLLGMLVGITGTITLFPSFIVGTLDSLKNCMGPVAMLLAGVTIANYNIKAMLKVKKTYVASALRLILLPAIIVMVLYLINLAIYKFFGISINYKSLYLAFFATAMPLGLNTVVFPEAYGGDPEPGAGMAMISSALSVLTIPSTYLLLTQLFANPFI